MKAKTKRPAAGALLLVAGVLRLAAAKAEDGLILKWGFDEVRAHHHMMVCAEAAEICREKWTAGGSYIRTLWGPDHGDLTAIAEYMVGQVRYIAGNKRYTPSRKLKKAAAGRPVKARRAEAELCVPRGCQQLWRSEYRRGVPQHIRYYRPPELMPAFPDDE